MYRQIRIHSDDWKFQRIYWQQDNEITKYEFTTVTDGLSCAPLLGLRVKQLILDDGLKYPLAGQILSNNRYIDDICGGSGTIDKAQEKVKQLIE